MTFALLALLTNAPGLSIAAEDQTTDRSLVNRNESNAAVVRAEFLKRLRRLAVEGNLFDSGSTAKILKMKLTSTVVPGLAPAACGDGRMKEGKVTTVHSSEPTWYRTLPSGAGNLEVPAFTINPATTTGDPAIEYRIYHEKFCRDWPRMQDHQQADVWFTGLPAFTCVTMESIRTEIPDARFEAATDGVSLMTFHGRTDDDAGTTLSFDFRAGVRCALTAELTQDQEQGLRYRRALVKYNACRTPSDRDFCALHPGLAWGDPEPMREMVLQAYERCGTVNSFYLKERATGEVPAELPLKHRNLPCDGL